MLDSGILSAHTLWSAIRTWGMRGIRVTSDTHEEKRRLDWTCCRELSRSRNPR